MGKGRIESFEIWAIACFQPLFRHLNLAIDYAKDHPHISFDELRNIFSKLGENE